MTDAPTSLQGDIVPAIPGLPVVTHTTGVLIGYWRCSSRGQDESRQVEALRAAGVTERWMFGDKISGKVMSRDGLDTALSHCRPGDALCVANLDRLGRDLASVLILVRDLTRQGIGLVTLLDRIKVDTRTNDLTSQMALLILAFLGEVELMMIDDRKRNAAENRARTGKPLGRPRSATPAQVEHAVLLRAAGDSHRLISEKTGIPKGSLSRYFTEVDAAAEILTA